MHIMKVTLKSGKEFERKFNGDDKVLIVGNVMDLLHHKYLTIDNFFIPTENIDYIEIVEE